MVSSMLPTQTSRTDTSGQRLLVSTLKAAVPTGWTTCSVMPGSTRQTFESTTGAARDMRVSTLTERCSMSPRRGLVFASLYAVDRSTSTSSPIRVENGLHLYQRAAERVPAFAVLQIQARADRRNSCIGKMALIAGLDWSRYGLRVNGVTDAYSNPSSCPRPRGLSYAT